MPSISFGEIFVVCLAILVFVKPEELPKFLRMVGRYYGQFSVYLQRIKDYGRDTYHEISNLDRPDASGNSTIKPGDSTPAPKAAPVPTAYSYSAPLDQIEIDDEPAAGPPAPLPAAPTTAPGLVAPPPAEPSPAASGPPVPPRD